MWIRTRSGFICALTILLLVSTSWLLGSRSTPFRWIVAFGGWLAVLGYFLPSGGPQAGQPCGTFGRMSALRPFLWGWLLLAVLCGASILNPIYTLSEANGSEVLVQRQHVEGLPVSVNSFRTAQRVAELSGVMILSCCLFSMVRSRREIRLILLSVVLNSSILTFVGCLFKFGGAEKVLGVREPVNSYFFSSFNYHNHWVAFAVLSMGAVLALGSYLYQMRGRIDRQRSEYWLCGISAGLIGLSMPLSGSRFGVVMTALWGGVILVFLVSGSKGSFRTKLVKLAAFIALGIPVFGYYASVASDALAGKRVQTANAWQSVQGGTEWWNLDQRFYAAPRDTLKMVRARPVWGWGLGSYEYAFFQYAGPEYRDDSGTLVMRNQHAHSDWLEFLAELGAVGFLGLLSVPALAFFRICRKGVFPLLSKWLLASSGLILTMALIEFPLQNPAVLLLFSVMITCALKYADLEHNRRLDG